MRSQLVFISKPASWDRISKAKTANTHPGKTGSRIFAIKVFYRNLHKYPVDRRKNVVYNRVKLRKVDKFRIAFLEIKNKFNSTTFKKEIISETK